MNLSNYIEMAHKTAVSKKFYEREFNFAEKVMLVVTELSEAVQEDRLGNTHSLAVELADSFIRLCDLMAFLEETQGLDFENIIQNKMQKNLSRPDLHDKKY